MKTDAMQQYQKRDWDVVDYDLYEEPGFPYALRGPQVRDLGQRHGVILGAAQSFGTLVIDPYAHRLTRATGLPLRNFAVGGSAPGLFLNNPVAIDAANRARFCIVQVMSARSASNAYFETRDGKNMMRPRGSDLPFVPGDTAFRAMFRQEPPLVAQLVVADLRNNWIRETIRLLRAIKVPKILLWFSKRGPDLPETFVTYEQAAGVYPQFVTRAMLDEVRPFAEHYVEVISSRGMPQPLVNRFTGAAATVLLGDNGTPRSEDNYYPSPEMHEDAFRALCPAVEAVV
jgi:hypothetical protein